MTAPAAAEDFLALTVIPGPARPAGQLFLKRSFTAHEALA
jgi:hypothetical protein